MGFPGAQRHEGSARTELKTNGICAVDKLKGTLLVVAVPERISIPKLGRSDSWWPRGRRQAPLSVGGFSKAERLGRVAAPHSRGILPARNRNLGSPAARPGSSPPELPAKPNRETLLGNR